jgi:hypothetical protein
LLNFLTQDGNRFFHFAIFLQPLTQGFAACGTKGFDAVFQRPVNAAVLLRQN